MAQWMHRNKTRLSKGEITKLPPGLGHLLRGPALWFFSGDGTLHAIRTECTMDNFTRVDEYPSDATLCSECVEICVVCFEPLELHMQLGSLNCPHFLHEACWWGLFNQPTQAMRCPQCAKPFSFDEMVVTYLVDRWFVLSL
jgi:hypothetical protein